MKSNAEIGITSKKSSVTLPVGELKLLEDLKQKLNLKTKVAVIRRGLELLYAQTNRNELREAYRQASLVTRSSLIEELRELDHLSDECLDH